MTFRNGFLSKRVRVKTTKPLHHHVQPLHPPFAAAFARSAERSDLTPPSLSAAERGPTRRGGLQPALRCRRGRGRWRRRAVRLAVLQVLHVGSLRLETRAGTWNQNLSEQLLEARDPGRAVSERSDRLRFLGFSFVESFWNRF